MKTLSLGSFDSSFTELVSRCTVAFWNTIPNKLVGRNMDWHAEVETEFYVLPRGLERNGMAGNNSMEWVSKYGSSIILYLAPVDGINEEGLAGHLLWLAESNYGERDNNIQGLNLGFWLQYYLDNFASVKEAVEFTENNNFQVEGMEFEGREVGIHLYLEDKSGDVAIIEYIDGKAVIHHGKENVVMTNSPTYNKQIENLKNYQTFGGNKELPGSTEAPDRFVRTMYYLKNLPAPLNFKDGVAKLLSVIRNASQPYRESIDPLRPEASVTRWRSIIDFTKGVYFFEATNSPDIVWLETKKLNYEKGADILKIKIQPNDNIGDITDKLEKTKNYVLPI